MEVYREIRKNQSPRSLRTALNIFAFNCPMIRPQKCRAFLSSLLPCFAKISKRTEELLYENIATSFTEIFKYLGPFAHDSEIKILCKDFIANLESNSAIIRRASATILVVVSQFSKNPAVALTQLLSKITDLLMPSLMEKSVSVIIGVLLCVRQCIPRIYAEIKNGNLRQPSAEQDSAVANLLQVYEMCMILCNHDDHNVITTSLETLQQLFTLPAEPMIIKLLSPSGIKNSLDEKSWNVRQIQTPPISSSENLAFCSDETSNLLESDLDLDLPKFRSIVASDASRDGKEFDPEQSISSSSRRDSDLFVIEGTLSDVGSSDGLHPSDDEHTENVQLEPNLVLHTFPEIQIGSVYEQNIPIFYCSRFLAYNFLLSGQKGIIRPDGEVRVSVKVLATNCIVNLVAICPKIFKMTLSHVLVDACSDGEKQQKIEDIGIYVSHSDPLLRGTIYVLIGTFIQSTLMSCLNSPLPEDVDFQSLTTILRGGLSDSSNVIVKCAVSGVSVCLHTLMASPSLVNLGESLLQNILQTTASNTYWLVKVDLVELLSSVDWGNLDNVDALRRKALLLFLDFLSDEDSRVRASSTTAIIKYLKKYGTQNKNSWEPYQLFCKECVANKVNIHRSSTLSKTKNDCLQCETPSSPDVMEMLEFVLHELGQRLKKADSKFAVAGVYAALSQLSDTFEPRHFKATWGCIPALSNVQLLLSICMDTLRTSPAVYDLTVHQSILCLAGNLFVASEFYKVGQEKEKTAAPEGMHPFRCHNKQLSIYGVQLLQHCLAVMKLYQNVIESINATSPLRRQSTSPVISPVKKFSQKLEAEKKAQESESEKKSKGLSFSETVCPNHLKKLHDSILQSYKVYKSSLDPVVASKFTSVIIMAAVTIRKLFSCIRPDYHAMSNLIEEILNVSSVLFYLCPAPIMQNICEMLKCIFSLYNPDPFKVESVDRINTKGDVEDFLNFSKTYENTLVESRSKDKPPGKLISDKSSLGSYIRQFESAVVTALRIYTTSSDPEVQSEVLSLLVQLIKGHVNYGLVDSSQVFLGFVTKQIPLLEEGHLRNPKLLAQEIFQFLTILTHEYNSSKKFIDVSKIISLCNGLVFGTANTASLASPAAEALRLIVHDLFIFRGTTSHTNQEKKEYESQRDAVFLMVKQLDGHPEALPIIWLLLKGRKLTNESKWLEESGMFASDIMDRLKEGRMTINSTSQFNNLVALLYSFNVSSMPSEDAISLMLKEELCKTNENMCQFLRWCVSVNSCWILLTKRIEDLSNGQMLNEASSLFLIFMDKIFSDFTSVFKDAIPANFAIDQIGCFFKISAHFLKSESCENTRHDLRSQDCVANFMTISKICSNLSIIDTRLRLWMVDFLAAILYPKISVWEVLLRPSRSFSSHAQSQCVLKIICAINDGDVPTLEEWIIVNQSKIILNYIDHPDVMLFIRRLSTYRMEQILDQITILLDAPVDNNLARNILSYLERVADSFLCETAILSVKLLKQTDIRFLSLEMSQFCCHALSHIHTRKLLFSNKDREFLRDYYSDPTLINRHPRLVTLARKVLCEDGPKPEFQSDQEGGDLILQWCSKDISDSEGIALVKMLSSMKYAQITAILNSAKLNTSILYYCFRHLRQSYQLGVVTAEDVSDLLKSQKRPGFIEKWPLPVAAVELILETLDAWESLASRSEQENYGESLLENHSLQTNICHMWAALTEMLLLKTAAIKLGVSEDKECCNNFIPTGIFTMSFQYMSTKCQKSTIIPFEDLRVFLKFAAVAVCDSSFLSFFDVRDNPPHIFACVSAVGNILRKLVQDLRINFSFSNAETDAYSGMNDECVVVLNEFHYLMEFVQSVDEGKIYLEPEIFDGLRNVVSGLGRCELVNGWILVSHLGWRPQALSKTNIFPPIQQIPLEILRNEADMLLKYISKLNLLGVASKIQFEENWVIFLSVINLYVDETFQLQIVTTGLRALSMMLQQSIKIKWSFPFVSEQMRTCSLKIDFTMEEVEPELCRKIGIRHLTLNTQRQFENDHGIDVNSCIRFLTDLYSQWLQNPQGKMPLHLLSEVIQSIVIMAEYFEDVSQYSWMYETLLEIHKSLDKEDEILWPHLMYGLFYSAAKITLEDDAVANLVTTLESSQIHPSANISNVSVQCALVYLQSHPDCLPVVNAILPYVLKRTQLDEMTSDSETHCLKVWKLLLFVWIHGPSEGLCAPDIEQDTLRNILTVLSPLNKVFVSVRLLVLKALQLKIENGAMKPDVKKTITKVTLETLRTPNVCIFFQAVKLYLTIFYDDFKDYIDKSDLDAEVLMPMAERADVLFQHLRSKTKCHNQIVSKVLPLVISDFLPPSEILNRVIAEFLAPSQNCPELVAPTVAQVFEKAKRRPKEAALVREWILASLPNFLSNANISRAMWSLTLFFIGVSSSPDVFCLLPFAQLRRNPSQVQELFVHAAIDFYMSLDEKKKAMFRKLVNEGPSHSDEKKEKKPYGFLFRVLDNLDLEQGQWAVDRVSDNNM
ncbi:huntingtin isoform X3 [Folsomia candida]|nr:huntingtin isoform X3 [Folsomia candida]